MLVALLYFLLDQGRTSSHSPTAHPHCCHGGVPRSCSAWRGDFKHGKALLHTTDNQKVPWAILQSFHEPELDKGRKTDQCKQRNTCLFAVPASPTEEWHSLMEARYSSYLTANSESPLMGLWVGGGYEWRESKSSAVWCAWNQLHLQIKHWQVCCCCRFWCDYCWNSAWEFWYQTSDCLISIIP